MVRATLESLCLRSLGVLQASTARMQASETVILCGGASRVTVSERDIDALYTGHLGWRAVRKIYRLRLVEPDSRLSGLIEENIQCPRRPLGFIIALDQM